MFSFLKRFQKGVPDLPPQSGWKDDVKDEVARKLFRVAEMETANRYIYDPAVCSTCVGGCRKSRAAPASHALQLEVKQLRHLKTIASFPWLASWSHSAADAAIPHGLVHCPACIADMSIQQDSAACHAFCGMALSACHAIGGLPTACKLGIMKQLQLCRKYAGESTTDGYSASVLFRKPANPQADEPSTSEAAPDSSKSQASEPSPGEPPPSHPPLMTTADLLCGGWILALGISSMQ